MKPAILEFTLANDVAELTRANHAVGEFLDAQKISPEAGYAVHLALEEILTNIVKYAYQDTGRHDISFKLVREPDCIVLEVQDDGHPFDPLTAASPDLGAPLEARKVGGLGIHLVRAFSREILYRRVGDHNWLEIRFELDSRPARPPSK